MRKNLLKLNYVNKISRNTNLNSLPEVKNKVNQLLQNPKKYNSIIGGKEYIGDSLHEIRSPLFKNKVIGHYSLIDNFDIDYKKAKEHWYNIPFKYKLDIFENIANMIEDKYYNDMMAATMVGQAKDPYQAEIDCIGELVDFLRFNNQYAIDIHNKQPISPENVTNISQYNPLPGFISSVTPFNFTAIAGNLALTPLLFGNAVYWKPSLKSLPSNYLFYQICLEANIPPEILNFIIMDPIKYHQKTITQPDLGGIIFTGSSNTFKTIKKDIGSNEDLYENNIRLIGETGGKNFHFIDKDCDIKNAAQETFYSAFDFSGQKCSACSRVYIHEDIKEEFTTEITKLVNKIDTTIYGVIDELAYQEKINYIKKIKEDPEINILSGGNYNNNNSYFIEPTICEIDNIDNWIWNTELFSPIVTIKTYNDNIIEHMNECSQHKYALTGSIFSNSRTVISKSNQIFRESCGNFYINEKSTGAVVGQQPFGGLKLSGTNDKAGDINFLYRLFSQRNLKFNNKIMTY
jgi:1-pyrroline-5-carboxylate dehydrogenase